MENEDYIYEMLGNYPDILKPAEVMEALGIGKNMFYDLIHSGELKARRIRNKIWRVSKQDLLNYINGTDY